MTIGNIMENLVFPKGPNKAALVEREGYTILRISLGKGGRIPPHMASHSAIER
ncbi:MAG: hypothetical protein ACW987_19860 [Candidatus Thorarchaeota archaeon]|jgi:hypothetical protein